MKRSRRQESRGKPQRKTGRRPLPLNEFRHRSPRRVERRAGKRGNARARMGVVSVECADADRNWMPVGCQPRQQTGTVVVAAGAGGGGGAAPVVVAAVTQRDAHRHRSDRECRGGEYHRRAQSGHRHRGGNALQGRRRFGQSRAGPLHHRHAPLSRGVAAGASHDDRAR